MELRRALKLQPTNYVVAKIDDRGVRNLTQGKTYNIISVHLHYNLNGRPYPYAVSFLIEDDESNKVAVSYREIDRI